MKIETHKVRFHHTGLLSTDIDKAVSVLGCFGYQAGKVVSDPLQQADLVLCCQDNNQVSTIEIIRPHASNEGLNRLLRRKGDYMYHSCFSCSSITKLITELEQKNIKTRLLTEVKPAVLFNNQLVVFVSVEGLGLVEFIVNNKTAI